MNRVHSDEGLGSSLRDTQPGAATNVADILTAAADLIEPEGAWVQGYFAANKYGVAVMGTVPEAVCWCAIGAIQRAVGANAALETIKARRAVEAVVGADVSGWNDAPERTQAEVVAALRAAAEKARTACAVGTEAEGRSAPNPTGESTQ